MSNWDDEDWDDEKVTPMASEPVGDWDDEDEENDEGGSATAAASEVLKKPSAPMRPKKALEKALRQREAEEAERERAKIEARERELAEMDEVSRKLKQQEMIEEADLENTKDLFSGGNFKAGVVKLRDDKDAVLTIDSFEPKTDADFEKMATMLGQKLGPFNTNPRRTGRYVQFLKHTLRALTKELNADDTNDLSTFLGVISNEKRDEQKRAKGIKKKPNKKASVKVDRAADLRSDRFDDFADDFM